MTSVFIYDIWYFHTNPCWLSVGLLVLISMTIGWVLANLFLGKLLNLQQAVISAQHDMLKPIMEAIENEEKKQK
jgi:hypothetical protein